jgi:phosphoserine phosphatase
MKKTFITLIIFTAILFITINRGYTENINPLSSWNDGSVKKSIIHFVENAIDPNSSGYMPHEDRIATFDNDGTLMVEKPIYFQIEYEFHYIKKMAETHPELRETEPYKSLYTDNMTSLFSMDFDELIFLLFNTHKGNIRTEYIKDVREFLGIQKHKRYNRPYKELIYLPMVELVQYLQKNNFKVYIVTGSEVGFVRSVSQELYKIPPEQVIGTFGLHEFKENENKTDIITGNILKINDREEKPVNIELFIGKKPVFAFGNSNGDIEMLKYTASSEYPSLCLLLHHDDEKREYSYDKGTEDALKIGEKRSWIIVNMKENFKKVFLFEN